MRIPWRGKTATVRSVGKSRAYDHQTVQAALDWIEAAGDNATDNRYVVDVDAGFYDDGAIDHHLSHVDVLVRPGAVLYRGTTETATGGTLAVAMGPGTPYAEDVWIGGGGRIVRNITGTKGAGSAPEAALYIGGAEDLPDDTQRFNDVTVENLIVEGVHDGIQVFGVGAGFAGSQTPLVTIRSCNIRSVHDALTYKGAMRMVSAANLMYVDTSGVHPYLDDVDDWKSTGFHMNISRPTAEDWSSFTAERWFRSLNDQVILVGGANIGNSSSVQDAFVGFYFYDGGSVAVGDLHPVELLNPSIVVQYDRDYTPSYFVNGIGINLAASGVSIPAGSFLASNVAVHLTQKNAGVSAPSSVHAVRLTGHAATGSREIEVTGRAFVSNAAGSAFVSRAEQATDTIYQAIRSRQANDAGGAGTISAIGVV